MKPWFLLFVLWALSGIVLLRQAYADSDSMSARRGQLVQDDAPRYAF